MKRFDAGNERFSDVVLPFDGQAAVECHKAWDGATGAAWMKWSDDCSIGVSDGVLRVVQDPLFAVGKCEDAGGFVVANHVAFRGLGSSVGSESQ